MVIIITTTIIIIWGGGGGKMVKLYFYLRIAILEHMLKKINTFIFWCMVIPLGSRLVYT